MLGSKITRRDLKARWAFGEFREPRWKSKYLPLNPDKIRIGVEFKDLTEAELDHLAWMLDQYRVAFTPALNVSDVYECVEWTKDQLSRTYTVPRMAPSRRERIPFLSFLCCPRFPQDGLFDPRAMADTIPFHTPFICKHPIIVVPNSGQDILLEGYTRAVLFMRTPELDRKIPVWYP
jgi:hypothetical protein